MSLHLLFRSPYERSSSFDDCLRFCKAGDAILLLENGVYAATNDSEFAAQLAELDNVSCYALTPDVSARGLKDKLARHVQLASDEDFVDLSVQQPKSLSWY